MAQTYTITVQVRGVRLALLLARAAKPIILLTQRFSPAAAARMIVTLSALIPRLIRVRAA